MPPKRKEDKKHDEDIDTSTLPQWISIFMMVEWEASISEISAIFPVFQFTQITRSDLFAYAKEKNFLPNNATESNASVAALAKALTEKVALFDLQGRKSKRDLLQKQENQDKPRTDSRPSALVAESTVPPIDPSKPDRIYLLTGFPKTPEEISAIGKVGCNIHLYFYIKPESSAAVSHSIKLFQNAVVTSEKNSPLRTFLAKVIPYDSAKYQAMENELMRLEEAKLERSDTNQEQEVLRQRNSKAFKRTGTKDFSKEEAKEVPQTPDLKKLFISDVMKVIGEYSQLYIRYLLWKESIPVKALYPSGLISEGFDSLSCAASSFPNEAIRSTQDLPSLDDAPKAWDFRAFTYLLYLHSDRCACIDYFALCALQHLTYSSLYYSKPISHQKSYESVGNAAETLRIRLKNIYFCNTEAREYFTRMYSIAKVYIPCISSNMYSNTEIRYFFNMNKYELDRMILISSFEDMIRKHTGKTCVIRRNYSESLSKSELISRLEKAMAYNPEIISSQNMDGSLQLAVFFDSSSPETSVWEHPRKIRPLFQEWNESHQYPSDFYDIDELKIGLISSIDHSFYPNDGSVLRMLTCNLTPHTFRRCHAVVGDCVFGLSEDYNEWWYYCEALRMRGSDNEVTCTCDGLVVRIGKEVMQELNKSLMEYRVSIGGQNEVNRVITGKGSVIRYLEDGRIQILFANGNISEYKEKWIVTNNKGNRISNGEVLEPMPCATITDPDTMLKSTFREDGTNIFYYKLKTVVEFADGTKILTADDHYLIESPCYAPVRVNCKDLSCEVLLSNGYRLSNRSGIKVEKDIVKISYINDIAYIENYYINMQDSTISITDSLHNYYQVGMKSEPIKRIVHKSTEFSNNYLLYLINPNGDASEILDDSQIHKRINERYCKIEETNIGGIDFQCYLTKDIVTAHEKGHLVNSFLHDYKYSNTFCKIKEQRIPIEDSLDKSWIYRSYEKYPDFTKEKRAQFKETYDKFLSWKKKQAAGKEFGQSEYSPITFEITRNSLLEKQKLFDPSKSKSKSELLSTIENFISANIIISEKNSLKSSTQALVPSYSPTSPKIIKSSKRSPILNSSIDSTLPSINYFKSPEGFSLSLASPASPASPSLHQPSPSPPHSRLHSQLEPECPEESPYIALVPQKGKRRVKLRPVVRSSCFSKLDQLQGLKEISDTQIAEEYHQIKSKDHDVYGSTRKSLPFVQSLRSPSPVSRINTRYVMSETMTDKRVRTISQTHMALFKAPNAQTFRRNSNVSRMQPSILADYISDPFRRVLEVLPALVDFGDVLIGQVHSRKVVLKNEDSLMVRFMIKQSKLQDLKVIFRPGPVAPGMISKLIVELVCRDVGEIRSEFEVYCKSEIYTIPVMANVLSEQSGQGVASDTIKGLSRKVRGKLLPSLNKSIA